MRVLLAVSGGIAAYKAPEIVRALVKEGAEVQVIMTANAAAFVTELSLATVSGRPVRKTLLDAAEEGRVGHIELADWAEIVVVAPATASLIAKAAAGIADDLVTTCLLATRAPVLWAPAMNTNMWRHPATQQNLATLASRGNRFVGPDEGDLACGWIGEGRMIDPPLIVDAAMKMQVADASWRGRRVIVSAGPTRAYLDPVRFFSNASTGEMGFAIAEVAARLGADVTLVAGPVQRPTPAGVRRLDVGTADEMLAAIDAELDASAADLVAMVAAVSDLAPANAAPAKLPKDDLLGALASGALVRGVDVLSTLTKRHPNRAFYLAFAAETVDGKDALASAGAAKLTAKGCDAVFVNRVAVADTGFGTPTNAGLLVLPGAEIRDSGMPVAKSALATWLLAQLSPYIEDAT